MRITIRLPARWTLYIHRIIDHDGDQVPHTLAFALVRRQRESTRRQTA